VERPGIQTLCSFEILLDDDETADSPYARRKFIVFRMANNRSS